jgi:pyrimidine operon attenuation protein / uracil phosphoribosyltransferase
VQAGGAFFRVHAGSDALLADDGVILLDGVAIRRAISRVAHEIVERNRDVGAVVLVGIRSRGVQLAERIAGKLEALAGQRVPVGSIDIARYRDDVETPERIEVTATDVPLPLDERTVVLVDDVIATGRTIRVALDVLGGLGRPRAVQVATLVDRGGREVPIRADYVGQNVPHDDPRRVHVRVREVDGADEVTLR